MSTEAFIYHIAEPQDWQDRDYSCASLQAEGFIHCATPAQLAGVVERYYSNRDDIWLLKIDVALLDAEKLVYENTVGGEELFPHYYGELPCKAVVEAERCNSNGILAVASKAPI